MRNLILNQIYSFNIYTLLNENSQNIISAHFDEFSKNLTILDKELKIYILNYEDIFSKFTLLKTIELDAIFYDNFELLEEISNYQGTNPSSTSVKFLLYKNEEETIYLITYTGKLIKIPLNGRYEINPLLQEGEILAVELASNLEYIAVASSNNRLHLFNYDFQLINSCDLDDGDQSNFNMDNPYDPKEASISWRGDSQFFATLYSINGGKKCIVRDTKLVIFKGPARADDKVVFSMAENPPSGSLISFFQNNSKTNNLNDFSAKPGVLFSEKNCLRHGEFWMKPNDLQFLNQNELNETKITGKILKWNMDMPLLLVYLEKESPNKETLYQINIYYRSNYDWSLKYSRSVEKVLWAKFSDCLPLRIFILTHTGTFETLDFKFEFQNSLINNNFNSDNGTISVLSGNKIKFTPLRYVTMPPPMCLQEIEINNKPPHIINWWKNYLFVISDGTIEIIYSDNLRNFSKLKKFENIKEINSNHIKSFIFVKNIKDQNQDEFTDFYETEGLLIISNNIPDNDKQDEILTILLKMKINLTTPTTDINRIEFLEVKNCFRRKFDKLSCMFNSTMSDNLFEKKSYEDKLSSLQINTIQIENKQKDLNLTKKNTGQGTNQDTWENLQRNDFENLDIDNYYNKKEHDDLNNDEDNLFSNLGMKNAKFDIAKLHKSTDINLNQPHPAGKFKIHFFAVVNKNKEKEICKIQISLNTNLLNDNNNNNNSNQEDKIMQINYEQESIASSNYDIVKAHSVIIKNEENTNTLDEKVVYLTRNNRLYLNNNYLAADTTSFEIFKNFLIFTQTSNSPYNILHILDMAKPESLNLKQQINKNDPIFTPNFNYKHFSMRTLERTSLIVSVSKNNIIVQLARGNIETFYPRILVLDSVVESVSNRKYLEAFELVRKNKINPNFLYDIDPEGFFFNIESFVKQINKIDYINLFINCLENNLCEEIQQLDNKIITKEDFKKLYIENKINKICDALRKELIKINENDKYITSIIHTHTKKTPSEYLEALRLIQSIKLKENETKSADDIFNLNKAHKKHKNADQALEYLCWVVNAEILFDFSLKTFDFELVILVAKYTQKDPKEYLPYLKKLQEMDPILMKYQINIDLKYYEDALFELSKSEEKYFDKSIELINKHELYELAFTLFSKNQNLLKTVFENYGRNLKTKKKFFEAGYAFLSNNNYPEALECFIENGSIIEILKILPKLNIQKTEEEIEKIFLEVIDITTSARKYNEIEKLLSYLESNPQYQKYSILSKLIDSLIRGKRFHLVLSIYLMENNKLDTKLKSEFLDSLSLCANLKSNELKKNIILFEEKYCRLLKVQHQKRLNPQLLSLDNKELEDNVSDSGSIISSSSKKSSKSKKTTSSRLTKKSQAKMSKRNVKEGSPLEEDFLIMIISELFLSEDHVNEINNLVNVLYLLGKSDEGKELSFVLKEYLKKINPNTKIYNVIQQDFFNKYPEIKEIFPNTFNVAKLDTQKNLITKD